MKPEIKQRWVEALQSGEYKQTTSYLKKDDCFCAIGVLCDLYTKDVGEEWQIHKDPYDQFTYGTLHTIQGFLPPQVQHWAGLDRMSVKIAGMVHRGSTAEYVASRDVEFWNDDQQLTFPEIGQMIQEQL